MQTATATETLDQLVLRHIQASYKNWRGGAYALLVMGALIWLIPDGYLSPKWDWRGKLAIFGIFAALGGTFLFLGFRDPAKNAGLRVLRERAADVVWAYVHTTKQNGSTTHSYVSLGLSDGKRVALPAAIKNEDELLAAVGRIAPQATLGYAESYEAAFRSDPGVLRRA